MEKPKTLTAEALQDVIAHTGAHALIVLSYRWIAWTFSSKADECTGLGA
jgi:hypothetical protein